MLNYLNQKKADLESKKALKEVVYTDIEAKVEEYRKELYSARNAEIDKHNMLIDAQVAILDEVIYETEKAIEAEEAKREAEAVEAVEDEQREVGI